MDPIEPIGSGGCATVYLYQQQMPRRRVAVKVIDVSSVATSEFESEADVMARVSAHPYIVSIFGAGVADDGRPYLVMEYYPNSNYLELARERRFDVPTVVRVGVQVAGALETAHRAGILHHDVKPANILVSEYGRPGLTDFGIASTDAGDGGQGVSIPWSPPEAFGNDALDVRGDVYSLAATLYHLLAGRSPFAVPGGANGQLELMTRIERSPVPKLGRGDVPASLERVLARAMSKNPRERPGSIVELARSLQSVEEELRLATTPLELPDVGRAQRPPPVDDDRNDHDATRARTVTVIGGQAGAGDGQTTSRTVARSRPDRHVDRVETDLADQRGETGDGGVRARDRSDVAGHRSMPWKVIGAVAAGAVALLAGVVLVGALGDSGAAERSDAPTTTVFSLTDGATSDLLGPVEGLNGVATDAGVEFSWQPPVDTPTGDIEYVYTTSSTAGSQTGRTTSLEVAVGSEPGVEVCIRVVVARQGSSDSGSRRVCASR